MACEQMAHEVREYLSSSTLVITGDNLDPDVVSRHLNLEPDRVWRKGDERVVGSKVHSYASGGWKRFMDQTLRGEYLEEQLRYWVSLLTGRRVSLQDFRDRGWNCVLSCFIGTDETASIVLPAAFQQELADLGVDIELSVFRGEHEVANKGAPPHGDDDGASPGTSISPSRVIVGVRYQGDPMIADRNIEATFCFVDIAGYTALTDSHGELAAADLVDDFSELIRTSVEPLGQIQELIGDCAFLVFPDPLVAIDALSALYKLIADRRNFPIVRAGLHHGSALFRGNRYFGSTVNLAARVAAQATGGQILCTKDIAEILIRAKISDIEIEHRGVVALRNLPQPVDLYEIVLSSSSREYAIDPVCKMQVDKGHAAGDLRFNKKTYWFCSLSCAERFAKEPSSYISVL